MNHAFARLTTTTTKEEAEERSAEALFYIDLSFPQQSVNFYNQLSASARI